MIWRVSFWLYFTLTGLYFRKLRDYWISLLKRSFGPMCCKSQKSGSLQLHDCWTITITTAFTATSIANNNHKTITASHATCVRNILLMCYAYNSQQYYDIPYNYLSITWLGNCDWVIFLWLAAAALPTALPRLELSRPETGPAPRHQVRNDQRHHSIDDIGKLCLSLPKSMRYFSSKGGTFCCCH